MNICSDGHDEVCYEARECPACLLKEDRNYFEDEITKLENKIRELVDRINELENKE